MKKIISIILFNVFSFGFSQGYNQTLNIPFEKVVYWTSDYINTIKSGSVDEKTDQGYYTFGFGMGKETYYATTNGVLSVKNVKYPVVIDRSVWGVRIKQISEEETALSIFLLFSTPNENYKKLIGTAKLTSSGKFEQDLITYLQAKNQAVTAPEKPKELTKNEVLAKIDNPSKSTQTSDFKKPKASKKEKTKKERTEKPAFVLEANTQEITVSEPIISQKTPKTETKPAFIPEKNAAEIPVSVKKEVAKKTEKPTFIPEDPNRIFAKRYVEAKTIEEKRMNSDLTSEMICTELATGNESKALELALKYEQFYQDLPFHREVFDYTQQKAIQNYDYGTTGRDEKTLAYMVVASLYNGGCTTANADKAMQYFEKAAANQNVEAMMNLADYYQYNEGFSNAESPTKKPNQAQELFWLKKAAALQYTEAIQILNLKMKMRENIAQP